VVAVAWALYNKPKADASAPQGSARTKPGARRKGNIRVDVHFNVLTGVPEQAILPLQGANFVYVVRDGKASRRQVGIGIRSPGIAEMRSGIDAGDTVVIGGQERLQDGSPVMVKPAPEVPAPAPGEGA